MEIRTTPIASVGGRYVLYGEIALGGMATVHIGRLLGTAGFARTVAIKRLLPHLARDPDFVSMFMDEARLVARIRHPNVVPTLDVLAADGQLLIVMEYVHGESLGRLRQMLHVQGKRIPPRIASAVLSSVLHGLHAAHEATNDDGAPLGIVHRDVSPQNVIVGTDGVSRVLDFGIAKAAGRVQTTREGSIKGKFAYMSPEHLNGESVGRSADIYAAAVLLWEMLTGERLFEGDTEAQVAVRVLKGATAPPSAFAPDVHPALDAVTMRGLARDPAARYATAREMAFALENALSPASATEVGGWVEAVAGQALSARARAVAHIERQSSLRLPTVSDVLSQLEVHPPGDPGEPPPFRPRGTSPSATPPAAVSSTLRIRSDGRTARTATSTRVARARLGMVTALSAVIALSCFGGGAFFVMRRARFARAPAPAPRSVAAAIAAESALPAPPSTGAPPTSCPDGMVPIPGGRFFMGSDEGAVTERPAHKVMLSPYCLDKFEVTTASYKQCSDSGECKRASTTNDWDGITPHDHEVYDPVCNIRDADSQGKHPINCVDWQMATDYCRAQGGRLPTEAEWEFAARGPDGRRYPWGDEEPSSARINACGAECVAWGKEHGVTLTAMYRSNDAWKTTAPVGSFPEGQSRYGVYDVVGNVWEWVSDWYGPYAETQSDAPPANPTGPNGTMRVIRGGGFNNSDSACVRPSFRFRQAPTSRTYATGFRCAKSL